MLLIDERYDESIQMPIQSASYPLAISAENTHLNLGAPDFTGCLSSMSVGNARVALGEQPGYGQNSPKNVWMPFPRGQKQEDCDITTQYGCYDVRNDFELFNLTRGHRNTFSTTFLKHRL